MSSRFSRQPERVVRARRLERTVFKIVDELPRHRSIRVAASRASRLEATPSGRAGLRLDE
eukprot:5770829-Prymnesium_polylepis.1